MPKTVNSPAGQGPKSAVPASNEPSVCFRSIVFSDGTRIDLQPTDVVVLVGPNNAGKSLALRELDMMLRHSQAGKVIRSVQISKDGTLDEVMGYIKNHTIEHVRRGRERQYRGYNIAIYESNVREYWKGDAVLGELASFFCMRLETQDRITGSNPAPSYKVLEEPVSNPVQLLYADDSLEKRISKYFKHAFGEDLIPFRLGGAEIPLLVGRRVRTKRGEDRISQTYCQRLLDATIPLADQGDGMRSFASVILRLMGPITPTILMLDEPEAFLHPPQARLLGELIAREHSSRAQLFLATHSPDVLGGVLNVAPERLRVLRIHRKRNVNHVKELDKEQAKTIGKDPLMKFSSVLSGVFHQRVIVCESDSDCLFYSSLLDLPEINGGENPDVLFVHANGKHRIKKLVQALVDLGVQVDAIVDIDILKNEDDLRLLYESFGGKWSSIQVGQKVVRTHVEQHKPWLTSREIANEIRRLLKDADVDEPFPDVKSTSIKRLFRKSSPWDVVKETGESGIPSGEASVVFSQVKQKCNRVGLWIVPVGELEGFCKSVGGHGPLWVQNVLERFDLVESEELKRARDFVKEVWTKAVK